MGLFILSWFRVLVAGIISWIISAHWTAEQKMAPISRPKEPDLKCGALETHSTGQLLEANPR